MAAASSAKPVLQRLRHGVYVGFVLLEEFDMLWIDAVRDPLERTGFKRAGDHRCFTQCLAGTCAVVYRHASRSNQGTRLWICVDPRCTGPGSRNSLSRCFPRLVHGPWIQQKSSELACSTHLPCQSTTPSRYHRWKAKLLQRPKRPGCRSLWIHRPTCWRRGCCRLQR